MTQTGAKFKEGGTLFSHTVNESKIWVPMGNNDFLVLKVLKILWDFMTCFFAFNSPKMGAHWRSAP
jgi:hypothetical protein